jgi:hypothetical protein
MSRRITEPTAPVDAFNPPDDGSVIVHDDATAQKYRQAAERARRRGPTCTFPDPQPAAPSGPQVDVRLATQARDKQVHALRADLARLDKEAQQSPVGATGMVVPHLADRQRQVQAGVDAIRREIERLHALDGQELIDWAIGSNLISWLQSGSAVL